jgi:hypothetical protein
VEPQAPTAQQRAIQEVRARYERGHLSFEAFCQALDALLQARDAAECQAIVSALPAEPLSALAALDAPAAASPASGRQRIAAVMGQTLKVRRPWRLAPEASVRAVMGEVRLDLGLAALPPVARLRVRAVMGTVILYVPRDVRVSVRTRVVLGEARALGELANGVVASSEEEHVPATGGDARLEIEVLALMGSVKVVLTDGPVVSLREVVGDIVRLAADGIRRGLQQGAQGTRPRAPLGAPDGYPPRA